MSDQVMLQINTNGAWRTVCEFDESKRSDVLVAARILHAALDGKAKWCTLSGEKRDWLHLEKETPTAVLLLQDYDGVDLCDFSCRFLPHQLPSSPAHLLAAHLTAAIVDVLKSAYAEAAQP